jgi:hypothetical protein
MSVPMNVPKLGKSSSKWKCQIRSSNHNKEDEMATALPILDIQESGADLARKTVFIKLHLGLLRKGIG